MGMDEKRLDQKGEKKEQAVFRLNYIDKCYIIFIMKIDQNPFSIYDFLGYLIPGLFFLYGFMIIIEYDFLSVTITNPLNFAELIPAANLQLDQYFIIIIIAYLIGHVLSYLSSMTVELYSIWTLGYPSRYILNLKYPGFRQNITKEPQKRKRLLKIMMTIYIFPVVLGDITIRSILGIRNLLGKQLDPVICKMIIKKIESYLTENFSKEDKDELKCDERTDFFNILYHYVLEKEPSHLSKLNNYVALYGFTRTLCFAVITMLWIIIIAGVGGRFSKWTTFAGVFLFLLAIILYFDFNKFYRKYSLETLMAFASNYVSSHTSLCNKN